jgi:hypothetical protein
MSSNKIKGIRVSDKSISNCLDCFSSIGFKNRYWVRKYPAIMQGRKKEVTNGQRKYNQKCT